MKSRKKIEWKTLNFGQNTTDALISKLLHHFDMALHDWQDPEVQKQATEILRKMLEQEEAELQVSDQC